MALNNQTYSPALPVPRLADSVSSSLAQDYRVCHEIMFAASKNYSAASRMLPVDTAHHVAALYAVMRVGDDRVDVDHGEFASPQAAIDDWRESYWRAFETGDSHYPVLRAYVATSAAFNIPPDLLTPYFRAMADDLAVTRFPTFDDLIHYMDGSAITVGRVMTHILGTRRGTVEAAYPSADALSIAMQLSNFWRDIGEDWERGRVYLPLEDMDRFAVSEADLAQRRVSQRMIDLLEFQFARTEQYYDQARTGVDRLASGRLGVMAALEYYRAILFGIRRNGYDVFTRRAGTTTAQKLLLLARAWWRTR